MQSVQGAEPGGWDAANGRGRGRGEEGSSRKVLVCRQLAAAVLDDQIHALESWSPKLFRSGCDGRGEETRADAASVGQGFELRQDLAERGAKMVRLLEGEHFGGVGGVFGIEAFKAEIQVRDVRGYGG